MADGEGSSGALTREMVDFNLAPAGYLHESWRPTLPHGEIYQALSDRPQAGRRLSRYLIDTFDLGAAFYDDFSEPRARLALLDGKYLESLFLYVGAALRSAELRNQLDGSKIATLRRVVGAGPLDYATKRTSFAGAPPDFSYEPEISEPRLRFMQIGAAYSISPRASAETSYLTRLALKLPHGMSKSLKADLPAAAGEPDSEALPPVTRRVVKEFLPQWLPLFD